MSPCKKSKATMRRRTRRRKKRKNVKKKSPTVGVRIAWVGLNRCVHQSTAEKAHELVAFGVRAADSAPSRSFGVLLSRVAPRDVHLQLPREFESSSACMCCSAWWTSLFYLVVLSRVSLLSSVSSFLMCVCIYIYIYIYKEIAGFYK